MIKYDTIPKLHSFFKYFERPFPQKSVIAARELGFAILPRKVKETLGILRSPHCVRIPKLYHLKYPLKYTLQTIVSAFSQEVLQLCM